MNTNNPNPKGQQEKLKCVKHKITLEVRRVPKSEAENLIKLDPDWHYTSKGAYKQTIKNEGRVRYTAGDYMTGRIKKDKGYFGKKITQVIEKTVPNPNFDPTPIVNKPRKRIVPPFVEKYKNPTTTITIKAPDNSPIKIKVIGRRKSDQFITELKRAVHYVAYGNPHPKYKAKSK